MLGVFSCAVVKYASCTLQIEYSRLPEKVVSGVKYSACEGKRESLYLLWEPQKVTRRDVRKNDMIDVGRSALEAQAL